MLPDLSIIFYLAIFGLICAGVVLAGLLVGGVWFLSSHVQIVW